MTTYTQEQAKKIYQGAAEKGLDPKKVVYLMAKQGAVFDGADMNSILDYGKKTYETPEDVKKQEFKAASAETTQDLKQTGQGIVDVVKDRFGKVKESFDAYNKGEQTGGETGFQTAVNVVRTPFDIAGELIKGGVKALLPENAETAVKETVGKVVGKTIETADELTTKYEDLKQKNPVLAGAINIALGSTPEIALNGKDMYEKYQELKKTDPRAARNIEAVFGVAQTAFDIATLGEGKAAATAADTAIEQGVKKTGEMAAEVGSKIAGAADEVAGSVANATKGIRNAAGEIIPTADRVVNDQVTKALQLTAGDVKNIESSTGNIVGQFMAEHNLIGSNLKETQKLIGDFFDTNYKAVREEIGKVTTKYKPADIPRYKQALTELKGQIEGVAGQEAKLAEIDALLKSKSASLSDVQRAKELIDDLNSLYKAGGDAKEGVIKQGLVTLRKDLQTFIEQEVKNTTGADIAELNNKVSTSKGILRAAEARATSGITKSNLQMGDLGAFGAGSFAGGPVGGAVAVIAKKIFDSPAIKFRIAKFFDGLSDARKLRIQAQLEKGIIPKEIEEIVQPSTKNAKATTTKTTTKSNSIPSSMQRTKKVVKGGKKK